MDSIHSVDMHTSVAANGPKISLSLLVCDSSTVAICKGTSFGQILGHFSPSDPGHLLSGSSTGRPYLPARCLAAYPPQNGSCSPSQLGGCGTRVRHRSLAARGNQCLLLAGDGLGADAEGAASPSRLRSFNSAAVDSSPTARGPSLALCVDQRDMSYLPDLYRKYVCSHVLISYLVALFHCSD
jgi:hypothetical protein